MPHDHAIRIEVALEGVDGVRDQIDGDERARTVVHGDVLVGGGHGIDAVHAGFLPNLARRGEHDGRDERIRVDGVLAIFRLAVLGADDDDEPHVGRRVKGFGRPGENRFAEHLEHLLAPGLPKRSPCPPATMTAAVEAPLDTRPSSDTLDASKVLIWWTNSSTSAGVSAAGPVAGSASSAVSSWGVCCMAFVLPKVLFMLPARLLPAGKAARFLGRGRRGRFA